MTRPDLRVRPAEAADLDGILALYGQPALDDGAVLSREDAHAIFARFSDYPDYTLFVAERGDAIVGTFALLVMDNLAHLGSPSAVVEAVAVAPERQGQGIGAAMMDHAVRLARQRGCYKLALSSNLKRDAAHAFYDGLGFERHGYSFRVALRVAS